MSFMKCMYFHSKLFTYRGLWGIGGPRVTHPECIVARIRKEWPQGFSSEEYGDAHVVHVPLTDVRWPLSTRHLH